MQTKTTPNVCIKACDLHERLVRSHCGDGVILKLNCEQERETRARMLELEDLENMQNEKFNSVSEEVETNTRKIKKLWSKYQSAKSEINVCISCERCIFPVRFSAANLIHDCLWNAYVDRTVVAW